MAPILENQNQLTSFFSKGRDVTAPTKSSVIFASHLTTDLPVTSRWKNVAAARRQSTGVRSTVDRRIVEQTIELHSIISDYSAELEAVAEKNHLAASVRQPC